MEHLIVGIDEVGRGCWAGPVVAGAVLLPDGFTVPEAAAWRLADSKTMSRHQREQADVEIRAVAQAFGLGWVAAAEVDSLGLTAAVALAMRRALQAVTAVYDDVIIDGSYNFLPDIPHARAVVKADGSVPAVSAASIIAKVARDGYMRRAAETYPGYGFESHVGYGTKQHASALRDLGVTELHRRSYRPVQAFC